MIIRNSYKKVNRTKVNENIIWGMPCFVDHTNKIVHIKCSSSMTAMGISAIVNNSYPGYKGQLVSQESLDRLRGQS
jgi:uncharacterized protein YdhG (YjbR/CyaY superfamily)